MRIKILILLTFLLARVPVLEAATVNLVPQPAYLETSHGSFRLNPGVTLTLSSDDPELMRLAWFFKEKIRAAGGPAIEILEPGKEISRKNMIRFMVTTGNDSLGSEGYSLQVSKKQVLLLAHDPKGIFYGIQTLFQLLPPEIEQGSSSPMKANWSIPCVQIVDFPRFAYRGLHLDVCRHFFPLSLIKEYIDLLAMFKMNTFHWHLTDDQGWRIEIKKYPLLTKVGAWRKGTQVAKSDVSDELPYGGFYTQEQIREVIKYAAERYITVIPEIEMPGHAVAALTAYPQYSCTGGPFEVRTIWGVSEDVYCAGKEETFQFIEDILSEVCGLFPSAYIHIGGDEVPKIRWSQCQLCQARMRQEGLKDENELQSYFIRRIEAFLISKGKKMIGWDEILEGGLAPEATVMSWRGMEGGIAAAREGHDVIMTPGSHCYLDHYQADPSYEPLSIGGYTPIQKVYSLEPIPQELNKEEARHILGAQGNVWTEYIESPEHVIYMAYPRAIALAEVDWTPASKRNWEDFRTRLKYIFNRLDLKGTHYAKNLYDVAISTLPDAGKYPLKASLSSEWKNMKIYYTTDGNEPNTHSVRYKKPFPVTKTSIIKSALYSGKTKMGRTTEKKVYIHKASGKPVELLQAYSPKYPGIGDQTLTDGLKGNLSYRAGEWQGYLENDLEVIIDLGEVIPVNKISMGFIKNTYSWIHLPYRVEFYLSEDHSFGQPAGAINCPATEKPAVEIRDFEQPFQGIKARYVKVKAYNNRVNPPWHESAGQPCWIFADEIIVE